MDKRYSRKKNVNGITLIKGNRYKRKDVMNNLSFANDYRGVTHYFTPNGNEIYSFSIFSRNNNNWKRPILTYHTNIYGLQEDVNTNKIVTRHVFFKDNACKDYEYLGTTTNEVHQNGIVKWTIN